MKKIRKTKVTQEREKRRRRDGPTLRNIYTFNNEHVRIPYRYKDTRLALDKKNIVRFNRKNYGSTEDLSGIFKAFLID